MTYTDVQLFVAGAWRDPADGRTLSVLNPATGAAIGRVAHAGQVDLDAALAGAEAGFRIWRGWTPAQRSRVMRRAASLLRERRAAIAALLTQEQGKPLAEAGADVNAAADIVDWFAEEGFRIYGRIVPHRADPAIRQMVVKDPAGPVARSRRGTFRSTKLCARWRRGWLPAAL